MFLDKMGNVTRREFMGSGLAGVGALGLGGVAFGEVEKTKKVREFMIEEWHSSFGLKNRNNPCLIDVEDVYMEDLGIGERIVIKGFDDVDDLRIFMEESPAYAVVEEALEGRQYISTFDEANLTFEVTRQK